LTPNLTTDSGALVGTVSGLWRYPVKSMAAEPLRSAQLSWAGVAGDRRWAFVRSGAVREHPRMCLYTARLADPDTPDKSDVDVQTPTGDTFRVHDPALAAELGAGIRLMRLDRGMFDAMPVSLISTRTVSALCELAEVPTNELRFRPNIVVAPIADGSFVEDDWVGSVLHIGDASVRVDRRDSRCVTVDVNPASGQPDARLLTVIGQQRRARAGVYGTVVRPGLVRLDDAVRITS
jgi:uncharacterized protein YcbX